MSTCIGIIFYRCGAKTETTQWDLEQKINMSVFPGLLMGPHNHAIAGIAVTMKAAKTEEAFACNFPQMISNLLKPTVFLLVLL